MVRGREGRQIADEANHLLPCSQKTHLLASEVLVAKDFLKTSPNALDRDGFKIGGGEDGIDDVGVVLLLGGGYCDMIYMPSAAVSSDTDTAANFATRIRFCAAYRE